MARLVEKASVGILLVVGVAYALAPGVVGPLLDPGFELLGSAVAWASTNLPQPVFLATIFLVTTAVSLLIALSFARVLYAILKRAGPRTTRVYRTITPSTPIGKVAVALFLSVGVLLGSIWILPGAIGNLGDGGAVSEGRELADEGSDAAERADDLAEEGLDEDRFAVFRGDAVVPGGDDGGEAPPYRRPTPDADGDRLKDSWERRGQTPDGVPLPNADPQRMDLYVQVNYGGGTIPLTRREKRQLRRVFAEMPVQNPDGSTGITLHLDDQRPNGGGIGRRVEISGTGSEEITQFYTSRYLGNRVCRYHQVVVGSIDRSQVAGRASAPGFAAVVESERRSYDGNVSFRVAIVTHELLHNVVGPIGTDGHTRQGWLSPTVDADDEFLSQRSANAINRNGLAGSGYYQQELCSG